MVLYIEFLPFLMAIGYFIEYIAIGYYVYIEFGSF